MIQPKYELGQQVWVVDVQQIEHRDRCPDCLGEKYWPITTPGGDSFDLECPTCRYGYEVRGFLTRHEVVAVAKCLTVGSIRIDTASTDRAVEYMMHDTGVGSGRVYNEADVFLTEDDVQPRLKEKCAEQQADRDRREAYRIADNKKRASKPDWKERRIRELEKRLKELNASEISADSA